MLKQITTPLLNIAYEEDGDNNDPVVLMLHGFPDDAKTWKKVSNRLIEKGYRVIAPYTRGYGKTTFLTNHYVKSGQYSALVSDTLQFCYALSLNRFILVGHDWGATTAYKVAALWPEKVVGLISLANGYNGMEQQILSMKQIQAYWYQWYFNTSQGVEKFKENRNEFCGHLWKVWSPNWHFSSEELDETAASWTNPDFVDIVVHSYRHRWKNAAGDVQFENLELQLKQKESIDVPTIFLQGIRDGASLPESSIGKESFFNNYYERRLLEDVGHFIQRENPDAVVKAIEDIIQPGIKLP